MEKCLLLSSSSSFLVCREIKTLSATTGCCKKQPESGNEQPISWKSWISCKKFARRLCQQGPFCPLAMIYTWLLALMSQHPAQHLPRLSQARNPVVTLFGSAEGQCWATLIFIFDFSWDQNTLINGLGSCVKRVVVTYSRERAVGTALGLSNLCF